MSALGLLCLRQISECCLQSKMIIPCLALVIQPHVSSRNALMFQNYVPMTHLYCHEVYVLILRGIIVNKRTLSLKSPIKRLFINFPDFNFLTRIYKESLFLFISHFIKLPFRIFSPNLYTKECGSLFSFRIEDVYLSTVKSTVPGGRINPLSCLYIPFR